jgi:starch synthase
VYNNSLGNTFNLKFKELARINDLEDSDLDAYVEGNSISLHKGAINYSDGVIIAHEELKESNAALLKKLEIPYLEFKNEEEYLNEYADFFKSLIPEE